MSYIWFISINIYQFKNTNTNNELVAPGGRNKIFSFLKFNLKKIKIEIIYNNKRMNRQLNKVK